jgi:hypothetical protein
MAEESFTNDLLRAAAAHLHLLTGMTAAREMFGKSYFSLGLGEKAAVDQAAFAQMVGNYQAITPTFLAGQPAQQPAGFGFPTSSPKPEKT